MSGRHPQAEATYRELLRSAPENSAAVHALGVIAQLSGDAELAAELFDAAIARSPDVAIYHNNCGEAYRALGDHERAISHYRKAIALDPRYPHPHLNLGLALQACARCDEAVARREVAFAPRFAARRRIRRRRRFRLRHVPAMTRR